MQGEAVCVWRSPKVEVRSSRFGGRSVFAAEPIARNERVAVKVGHVVGFGEAERLTAELGDYSLQIDHELFLSPRSPADYHTMVVHIDHSCEANVGFSGNVVYVALRDIAAGEELCHDYALARTKPYRLDCECGTPACRGTITESDWRLPEVQDRYRGYFMPHVQELIDSTASAAGSPPRR